MPGDNLAWYNKNDKSPSKMTSFESIMLFNLIWHHHTSNIYDPISKVKEKNHHPLTNKPNKHGG